MRRKDSFDCTQWLSSRSLLALRRVDGNDVEGISSDINNWVAWRCEVIDLSHDGRNVSALKMIERIEINTVCRTNLAKSTLLYGGREMAHAMFRTSKAGI